MYDLVIIGSGPAGLSAAVYAKRACLDVVVLEKEPMGGGQMIYTQEVDNYLGLPETNGFYGSSSVAGNNSRNICVCTSC